MKERVEDPVGERADARQERAGNAGTSPELPCLKFVESLRGEHVDRSQRAGSLAHDLFDLDSTLGTGKDPGTGTIAVDDKGKVELTTN